MRVPDACDRGSFNIIELHLLFVEVDGILPHEERPPIGQNEIEAMKQQEHPLLTLDHDDLEFIVQLVLASGSLKDLAGHYSVSYPTIRARLDRVLARLKGALEGKPVDAMAELLGDLVERGEMTLRAAKSVLELHRATVRERSSQNV